MGDRGGRLTYTSRLQCRGAVFLVHTGVYKYFGTAWHECCAEDLWTANMPLWSEEEKKLEQRKFFYKRSSWRASIRPPQPFTSIFTLSITNTNISKTIAITIHTLCKFPKSEIILHNSPKCPAPS